MIELMIVVAIIGVLAAIAFPQYQNYVIRSRWADNIASTASLKAAIGECVQNNNGSVAVGVCDTIGNASSGLIGNGFLATNFNNSAGPYMAGPVALVPVTGELVISGTLVTAAGCVVTLRPTTTPNGSRITWAATTSGAAGCNRSKTGVGT